MNWGVYCIDFKDWKYEGGGISEGELVEIEVNLTDGNFKVIVEGNVRAQIDNVSFLKNRRK